MPGTTPELGTSVLSDSELIEKAKSASNGNKFTALYEEGWESQAVRRLYEKPRYARLALVVHLTWWARHDTAQVRQLFKQSALSPSNLQQYSDYFADLFQSAISLLGNECYNPNYSTENKDN